MGGIPKRLNQLISSSSPQLHLLRGKATCSNCENEVKVWRDHTAPSVCEIPKRSLLRLVAQASEVDGGKNSRRKLGAKLRA